MDTRHTVGGYSETASALSDETDAVERERLQDIEMAERRKREAKERKEAQAMEMAKIDAQLEAEEQKIQIQMDMEKARLAQDKELAEQQMAKDACRRQFWNYRRKPSTTLDYANFMTDSMEMRQQSGDPRPHRYWQPHRITDHPTCQIHGKNLYSHILWKTINLVHSSMNSLVFTLTHTHSLNTDAHTHS